MPEDRPYPGESPGMFARRRAAMGFNPGGFGAPPSPRRRAVSRVARGSFPQRGAGLPLSDMLRSALMPQGMPEGMGERGPGMTLADVLRSGQAPTAVPEVMAPAAPLVDTAEQSFVDPLASLPMIESLQNQPQMIARNLAEEVSAGKISMAEAVARYRAMRFGGGL